MTERRKTPRPRRSLNVWVFYCDANLGLYRNHCNRHVFVDVEKVLAKARQFCSIRPIIERLGC
ncbi:hypothetical protein SynPROSU1_01495 [Synechococcus sp. PROS-U-1]|nr:hypothetical protein SynPROSU1_01495 [Synechococcus sp. PROS-U-1]